MKVLILVQSFEGDSTFYEKGDLSYEHLQKAQEETWDSVNNPDTQTFYYFPSLTKNGIEGNKIYLKGPLEYNFMFIHMVKAFTHLLKFEWDYIFKTDNSTYINKEQLLKTLTNKPRFKFYGGHLFNAPEGFHEFLWGEGVAFSRDVVEKLIDMYSMYPNDFLGVDDGVTGYLLSGRAEWDKTMTIIDYWTEKDKLPLNHIYRCKKSESTTTLFADEIKAMKDIYQKFTS